MGRFRLQALFVVVVLMGWLAPIALSVNLRTEAAPRAQFELAVSPCCILPAAPQRITLRGRYDHAKVVGTVCFVVDGTEYHTSCWQSDEETAPLVVRTFLLEHEGEYAIAMLTVDGNTRSMVQTIVIQ